MTTLTKRQNRMLAKAAPAQALLMTEEEARGAVQGVLDALRKAESHVTSAGALLLDLQEREGWRALGYENWRACILSEFPQSERHLFRMLAHAKIERNLLADAEIRGLLGVEDMTNGHIPESHAREINRLDDPDKQRAAYRTALEATEGTPTAAETKAAVDLIVGQRTDPNKPDPKEPPAPTTDAGRVGAIRRYLAQQGAKVWTKEAFDTANRMASDIFDGDTFRAMVQEIARSTNGGKGMLSRPPEPGDPGPHLPPSADYKAAQERAAALGLRMDMNAQGAFIFYRLSDASVHSGAVDWPAALNLIGRNEADRFRNLIERAEALGATINPTAYDDPAYVQVVPPPRYQQTPLKCSAGDLADRVRAWEKNAQPAPAAPKARADWWNCGVERKAFDTALNAGDQLRAARAAFALGIAVAGDATRLALAQAERGAGVLEAEGLASLASLVRMLIAEEAAS